MGVGAGVTTTSAASELGLRGGGRAVRSRPASLAAAAEAKPAAVATGVGVDFAAVGAVGAAAAAPPAAGALVATAGTAGLVGAAAGGAKRGL